MRASTYWYILTVVFFVVTVISALGEWVFHWWKDPGQWVSVLGLALTLASFGFGASSGQVEAGRAEQRRNHGELVSHLGALTQDQRHVVEGQERLVEGQERLVQGQERLVQGQIEQTGLLRQVVDSFRGRVP